MKWLKEMPRWLVWGLALPLVVLNGWILVNLLDYFRQFVTVFIGANLLAFVLNYPVQALQRSGFSRDRAILVVLVLTISILLVLGVTLIPALVDQVNRLVAQLPQWLESGNQQLQALQDQARDRRLPVNLLELATLIQTSLVAQLQAIGGQVVGVGIGLAGFALDFTLMMVFTIYLLMHGDRLWGGILKWLPDDWGMRLQASFRRNFHNYFSGQATLALLIGSAMIILFLVLQVPFGLLFGLGIGAMTMIPFGAPTTVCLVSFLVALSDFWLGFKMFVAGMVIEQLIENAIAPRLLGRFTGLNPVWVLASLLLGIRIAGVLGLLMAVPIAGFIKSMADVLWDKQMEQELSLPHE